MAPNPEENDSSMRRSIYTKVDAHGLAPDAGRSIRARQPPYRELDAIAREHAPGFDLGHVRRFGIAAKQLARLLARGGPRQRKGLAPEAVARAGAAAERLRGTAGDIGGAADGVHGTCLCPGM